MAWSLERAGAVLAILLLLAAAGCAAHSNADGSLSFDATSDKAIVVLGAGIWWQENYSDPDQSLTLHWQAFNPKTLHLLPDGPAFTSLVRDAVRLGRDDPRPPPQVLLVEPGSYALVAAGSGVSKSLYVPLQARYRNKWGMTTVKDFHLEPQKYIDPGAVVAYGRNQLFTVEAGQIVYLGHYEFRRTSKYHSGFHWSHRVEDLPAARQALAEYPGIEGVMIALDPSRPPQSVAR